LKIFIDCKQSSSSSKLIVKEFGVHNEDDENNPLDDENNSLDENSQLNVANEVQLAL